MIPNPKLEILYVSECASPVIQEAFQSIPMYSSHAIVFVLTIASFIITAFAFLKLKSSALPISTKRLLYMTMGNGLLHQLITTVIRALGIYKIIRYHHDPCSLLFKLTDCFFLQIFYYYSNMYSSLCCVALFVNSFLTRKRKSFFGKRNTCMFCFYVLLLFLVPALHSIWIFHDSNWDGYVPMCNYPSASASFKFYIASGIRFIVLGIINIFSWFLNRSNKRKTFQVTHISYDVNDRYAVFENYLGSRALFIIIAAQVACLTVPSLMPIFFEIFRNVIPEHIQHWVIAFTPGLTISNFLTPILLLFLLATIQKQKKKKLRASQLESKLASTINIPREVSTLNWAHPADPARRAGDDKTVEALAAENLEMKPLNRAERRLSEISNSSRSIHSSRSINSRRSINSNRS